MESNHELLATIERVIYHNEVTGWSVLEVSPFSDDELCSERKHRVNVCQQNIQQGSTWKFSGSWISHAVYGPQFKAATALPYRPASKQGIEKYLSSGIIKGIGPKMAASITAQFGDKTLEILDKEPTMLRFIKGVGRKKLSSIIESWKQHTSDRETMLFLHSLGMANNFAVKVYKAYGPETINLLSHNPYKIIDDFAGIGFKTADSIASFLYIAKDSSVRIAAAIKSVLKNARTEGHCYLTGDQVVERVAELLSLSDSFSVPMEMPAILGMLDEMEIREDLKVRIIEKDGNSLTCYYYKKTFHDENTVVNKIRGLLYQSVSLKATLPELSQWIDNFASSKSIQLSVEQKQAILTVIQNKVSILTGLPGTGKSTSLKILVSLLLDQNQKVLLAAPTGRAAQRMSEVIGMEAKTIHRLLEFGEAGFGHNETNPLSCNYLIIDESSMKDLSLSAAVLKALPKQASLILIGDADQLPPVGAGCVFKDLIESGVVPVARLTQIHRQAASSKITTFAHQVNRGEMPDIKTPFADPSLWKDTDCMFIDTEQTTKAQTAFIHKVRKHLDTVGGDVNSDMSDFKVPSKFEHVNLDDLLHAGTHTEELRAVVRKVPVYSSLNWGCDAVEMVCRLYTDTIKKYHGEGMEVQILSPMIKGSLGVENLNREIQNRINPSDKDKHEYRASKDVIFRVGDRVLQTRNVYRLNVFNGDIGHITAINAEKASLTIKYMMGQTQKEIHYGKEDIAHLSLGYAITIHKSQGSEFDAVIIPLLNQHFKMLYRKLVYTAMTRGKKLTVFAGSRFAFRRAIENHNVVPRQTAITWMLQQSVERIVV